MIRIPFLNSPPPFLESHSLAESQLLSHFSPVGAASKTQKTTRRVEGLGFIPKTSSRLQNKHTQTFTFEAGVCFFSVETVQSLKVVERFPFRTIRSPAWSGWAKLPIHGKNPSMGKNINPNSFCESHFFGSDVVFFGEKSWVMTFFQPTVSAIYLNTLYDPDKTVNVETQPSDTWRDAYPCFNLLPRLSRYFFWKLQSTRNT